MTLQDIGSSLGNFFQGFNPFQQSQPLPQPQGNAINTKFGQIPFHGPQVQQAQAATMAPTPTSQPADLNGLSERIRAGMRQWNGGQPVPAEQYIPQMVQATQQYPIFAQHPFLIPSVSIVETGAGKNWKLNHNMLSWAARAQQAGQYSPATDEQSIQDMISAVGGDKNRGQGYGNLAAQRLAQIAAYEQFRQSGNIQDFTNTYEPPSGNPNYYPALQKAMGYFK